MEMRNLICHILLHFDNIELAPDEDGFLLMNMTKDHFTAGLQSFKMVFKPR